MLRVGLIGDYDPEVPAHIAIPRAIALAAQALERDAEAIWLPTPRLENDTGQLLAGMVSPVRSTCMTSSSLTPLCAMRSTAWR